MNQDIFHTSTERPALPEPQLARWQPLRLGLVELFHYDCEEFWFRDGHLLLRGNNGTGKSKVLSLTLPFLFDANLHSGRIEPDGDSGKKMAWNLLMNAYPRRIGYAWIEFGRLAEDGSPRYLTLGAGMSAVAARAHVDRWFFILDEDHGGRRIGRDLWLTNAQRVVLTKERLRDAIEGVGQVFESANPYRRAVDERLFHLGDARYQALMDTLIQLRQPQLSRKPDEGGLSHALTEALPPMPQELLGDVAEALNQLEEDRRQLDEIKALAQAIARFEERYRLYCSVMSRRQARELRQAQTEFDKASGESHRAEEHRKAELVEYGHAVERQESAERAFAAQRSRLDTLQADPRNQDANRLAEANADALRAHEAVEKTARSLTGFTQTFAKEGRLSREAAARAAKAETALQASREQCAKFAEPAGVGSVFQQNALVTLAQSDLADVSERELVAAQKQLRDTVGERLAQLKFLAQKHRDVDVAVTTLQHRQSAQSELKDEWQDASEKRAAADAGVDKAGLSFVEAWAAHCASLVQLRVDTGDVLRDLEAWIPQPQGENPGRLALALVHERRVGELASAKLANTLRHDEVNGESEALGIERDALLQGKDAQPMAPRTRSADSRSGLRGAAFWQLVEFQPTLPEKYRAGLEAALEASGLLDAWVTPTGVVVNQEGTPAWADTQWVQRPVLPELALSKWLQPSIPDQSAVSADVVERLLAQINCSLSDPQTSEIWIALDGRFRLGSLAGAWNKPQATFIGHAARAAARARRLEEIRLRLQALHIDQAEIRRRFEEIEADRLQVEGEWRHAPSDERLRRAIRDAEVAAAEFQRAWNKLEMAEARCREAEQSLQAMRESLARDATDLRLPIDASKLPPIEQALMGFNGAQYELAQAVDRWRQASADLARQQQRETDAARHVDATREQLSQQERQAQESQARYDTLLATLGTTVEALTEQLREARADLKHAEESEKSERVAVTAALTRKINSEHAAQSAQLALDQRSRIRAGAVSQLQRFAASSLLSSALPELELPESGSAWTIDPALSLARRIEQALSGLNDDETSWNRVKQQVTENLQELQTAMSALGHQAAAETSDWGFVVHILFHNRPERPDQLARRLGTEIQERSELLSANERMVLENHLQAEIAAEVQRLLRAAEQQVVAINKELHKRPTSTGVRYRLLWQPLGEEEGAPTGLAPARERLLNTSADLWSADDRRAIGTMLQQRIAAERERSEAQITRGAGDAGGSLIDQLARALDYRRWHRFRVERQQDGQWRKLSGPASSGERALGLTVPLFAAIASFYSHGSNPLAPRLMLLDEAFAGIDDDARAHCMGLIREFDLDFVITSEREWACYAELPGVSICQLQRREGVDAIFVSRWTWDGRAKRREEDPDRRFPA